MTSREIVKEFYLSQIKEGNITMIQNVPPIHHHLIEELVSEKKVTNTNNYLLAI